MLQKQKSFRVFILFTLLALLTSFRTAKVVQQTGTAYLYRMHTGTSLPFRYTKTYQSEEGGQAYRTVYKLFSPSNGKHYYTITAVHENEEQVVRVRVEDARNPIFGIENEEKVSYEKPTAKVFGFRGNVGLLGGKDVPNQLAVQFVSSKFEHVRVLSVMATSEGGDFQFFILEK